MSDDGASLGALSPDPLRLGRNRFALGAMVFVALVGAAVLFSRDPATPGFYPACPFHRLTGLYCPGCGSTRAIHQLLHGHLGRALAYNPAMVAALPFLGYAFFGHVRRVAFGVPRRERRLPPVLILMIAGALSLFWILRNVPYPPFTFLAPHALPH